MESTSALHQTLPGSSPPLSKKDTETSEGVPNDTKTSQEQATPTEKTEPNSTKKEEKDTTIEKPESNKPNPPTSTTIIRSTETASSSDEDEDGSENSFLDLDDESTHGPLVDMETFGQLLEMDDDEEHSFSKSLTWDYFEQVSITFRLSSCRGPLITHFSPLFSRLLPPSKKWMRQCQSSSRKNQRLGLYTEIDPFLQIYSLGGDLITLSRKGHFLKGSSAALGLNKVKASCEKMQHYGNKKKANGEGTLTESEAMDHCKLLLRQLKEEQKFSKAWLERFYAERNV
ncbi:hypothetical protein Pst134EB_022104 [Puccinia striiformis f. sp. tritici]|nr:hypothetical protein Pst134EB_022104 [Puccinia striiformis f. sp. tritici]